MKTVLAVTLCMAMSGLHAGIGQDPHSRVGLIHCELTEPSGWQVERFSVPLWTTDHNVYYHNGTMYRQTWATIEKEYPTAEAYYYRIDRRIGRGYKMDNGHAVASGPCFLQSNGEREF